MTRDMPLVGVTLSPNVQPNTDWYARSVLKTTANTPTTTAPSSLFTSIANKAYSFKTKRGRTYDLGRTEAGTIDLRVDNTSGSFNPLNSSNGLYPFCPVRVTCAYPRTGNILNDTNQGYIGEVTAVVTAATGGSGTVTYTANNTFQKGQQVSVTGLSVGALNLSGQIITSATTTAFSVANSATGTVSGQSATASLDLPETWADYAVSVCANDANFDLGRISNWYSFGAAPAVTNFDKISGAYSMLLGNTQRNLLDVPCVAGQSVTFSFYARSQSGTSSGTMGIYAGGYINSSQAMTVSSSFSTSTTWTRYSITTTATAPKITISLLGTGSINNLIDNVQVEFGSTAKTYSTTGSTVYNIFNGFIERFPQSFQAPNRGEVNMVGVDAVTLMSQNTLVNPYSALVLQDPDSYLFFPLNEANNVVADVYSATYSGGSITFQALNSFVVGDLVTVTGMGANSVENMYVSYADATSFRGIFPGSGTTYGAGVATATRVYSQSGNAYANTTAQGYTSGAGTITLGEQNNLVGFNGDTNAHFKATSSETAEIVLTVPSGVVSAVGTNFCLDVWVKWNTAGLFLNLIHADSSNTQVSITTGGFLSVTRSGTGGGTRTQSSAYNSFPAGTWRLVRLYYDGTNLNMGVADNDSTTGTSVFNYTFSSFAVPASDVRSIGLGSLASGFEGSFAALRYGKYNSLNQGSSISKNLLQVGWSGYSGAKTGSRFADLMQNYSGFNYTPIASDLGVNHSGALNLAGRTLQDVVQITSDTEQGYWYVDGSGFVTFKDQTHRKYSTPNLVATKFADNATDVQYQGDSININYDLTFVYNQVTVTCAGATYYAEDNTSINRYYPRTLQLETENAFPAEVTSLANNLLAKYKDPKGRLETITFTPMRNPSIWQPILALEVGDYVQVTRSPYGQTAITFKGWVEQIEHEFDAQTGDWLVHVNVSPHLPIA